MTYEAAPDASPNEVYRELERRLDLLNGLYPNCERYRLRKSTNDWHRESLDYTALGPGLVVNLNISSVCEVAICFNIFDEPLENALERLENKFDNKLSLT
jgi:hypothetical protein